VGGMSKPLDTMSNGELRTACERMLRPCATCGHAEIDHRHDDARNTRCSVDLGDDVRIVPCGCRAYEVQP